AARRETSRGSCRTRRRRRSQKRAPEDALARTLPLLAMSVPRRRAIPAISVALAACLLSADAPASTPPDSFDDLYARGQKANAAIKTLTARFPETTPSSLLTKPMVARGRLAVERPSRVI